MKNLRLIVLFGGLCCLAFNSRAQVTGSLTNGLIAYYPFNGNANDASGNSNNGTVFGATLTTDRFGQSGMAYQFNGTNNYISANVGNLPTGSAPRSISLWAKPEPQIPYQGTYLAFWGTNQNAEGFGPLNISSPYQWEGGGVGGGNSVNTGVLVDTNWHQIVQIYSGTAMSMWIDGTNYGAATIFISTPLSPLIIGSGPSTEYFSGVINDVRIYNRALSAQEVSQLYSAESLIAGIITLPTVTIQGLTNKTYSIQYSTNLSLTNWTTLVSNIVIQTSPYLYPDTNSLNQPQRFYRVIVQ